MTKLKNGRPEPHVVYDKVRADIDRDAHGHFKVYYNANSAKRRASMQNNGTCPKIDRWTAVPFRSIIDRV